MNEPAGFRHGMFAGFAALVVLLQLSLAVELRGFAAMYREFGDAELSVATRVMLHPLWRWGAPLAGAALVGLLLVRRPRALVAYIVVGVALAAACAATWYFSRAPLFALASAIK